MKINVMMASGDIDEWEDAYDAIEDSGSLIVLFEIEGEEIPAGLKTLVLSQEIPQPGREGVIEIPEPMVKSQTFQVAAQYAPGMWMKVEFE